MSCTVSEMPSGCRLRGMGSSSVQSGVVGGNSGNNMVGTTGIHGVLSGPTPLVSNNETQLQRPQKPCCLCWCCCCSCSWNKCLQLKNPEDNGPSKRDPAGTDLLLDGEQPSLEEIRGWGKSFDRLMKSPGGRKVFRDFLRSEYSEENILFWLACEELKMESSPSAIEEKARKIYEDYINILSPKEVSLDSRVKEIVNRNIVNPTPNTFDEAQLQIYTLMHRDSYSRFINSQLFKSLAQIEGLSASGSTTESPTT